MCAFSICLCVSQDLFQSLISIATVFSVPVPEVSRADAALFAFLFFSQKFFFFKCVKRNVCVRECVEVVGERERELVGSRDGIERTIWRAIECGCISVWCR